MKKILIAISLLVMASIPANAGSNPWPVIGGIAGGLLLGEVLTDHHHHRHQRYYEDEYDYEYSPMCWTEEIRDWDPYRRQYYIRRIRHCD